MADFDDLPGFAPPPTRPTAEFAVEPERRSRREPVEPAASDDSLSFRLRVRLQRAGGSSTAMLLVATLLVGGTVAVTRAARGPRPRSPHPIYTTPVGPPRVAPEVPEGSFVPRVDELPEREKGPKPRGKRTSTFRFASGGGGPAPAPLAGSTSSDRPQPAAPGDGETTTSEKPRPRPSPSPYTPTSILIRLLHPNGAYYFTTNSATATEKEGYDGYVSERAALVWSERRGPTMLRLELSDNSVGFVYAREQDVDTGEPAPLYAASTRRYGRFYSLDRDQAAEIGPVVVYGWVATY